MSTAGTMQYHRYHLKPNTCTVLLFPAKTSLMNREKFHHGVCNGTPGRPIQHQSWPCRQLTTPTQLQRLEQLSTKALQQGRKHLGAWHLLSWGEGSQPGAFPPAWVKSHMCYQSMLWGHTSWTPWEASLHERDMAGIARGTPGSSSKVILRR